MADTTTTNEMLVLTKDGLQKFAEEFLGVVNSRIDAIKVANVTESDSTHTPTAAAVYSAISGIKNIMPLVIASGDPSEANIAPNEKTLYVVRKTATDKESIAYIYLANIGYVTLGAAPTDAETDLQPITDEDIVDVVAAAAAATAPGL